MAVQKPPTTVELEWQGELKFSVTTRRSSLTLDGHGAAGPSPVDALGAALAGCMSVDVADILTKGRHPLRALRAHLVAERADTDPRRFVRVTLAFTIEGDVPDDAVTRAIALSREKYCSVWHSLRQDIDFTTTYERRA